MDDKSQVVKHLEMAQATISRLAHGAFLVKGWSIAILSVAVIFIARNDAHNEWLILAFVIPVAGFWGLDGYLLWQERLFRGVYEDTRKRETTDFAMDIPTQKKKPGNTWRNAVFSVTLVAFYLIELAFIVAVFAILKVR